MRSLLDWLLRHGRLLSTLSTLILGGVAILLAGVGMYLDDAFHATLDRDGFWPAWSGLLLDAARMPALSEPADPPTNGWYVAARIVALVFALAAALTILAEVSERFSQWLGRRFQIARSQWAAFTKRTDSRGHVVVFGLGWIGRQVIADLHASTRRVIVVEIDPDNPGVAEARGNGALVLFGDARDKRLRKRIGLHLASFVVVATGDEAVNIDVAAELVGDVDVKRRRSIQTLPVYVHVGDPGAAEIYAAQRLFPRGGGVDVQVFNFHERVARDLLLHTNYSPPGEDQPSVGVGLARRYRPSALQVAHWAVIGFGPMGQTVALQAARLGHFENRLRLRLTLVDDFAGTADRAKACFVDKHPGFGPDPSTFSIDTHLASPRVTDGVDRDGWQASHWRPAHAGWHTRTDTNHAVEYAVNAEYLDLPTEVDAPQVVDALVRRFSHGDPPVSPAVVVCFEDERRTFRTVLALHHALIEADALTQQVPIFAYLPTEKGLAALLASDPAFGEDASVPVHPFGSFKPGELLRWMTQPHLTTMARALHEVYDGLWPGERFDELSPALQRSNEDAVAHLDVKLDAIQATRRRRRPDDYVPDIPTNDNREVPFVFADGDRLDGDFETLRRMEHNRWMGERLSLGWRYGRKAPKRRPSFVPWEALPAAEKRKDDDQIRSLPHLVRIVEQSVVRDDVDQSPPPASGGTTV